MNKRPLAPKGGNDRVYTPEDLAIKIIKHFSPSGPILDPCRGHGVFFNNFPYNGGNDWCEIDEGKDFFEYKGKDFSWVISNPPWSKIRPFLQKSMEVSDNVVFLCLINAFFMKARLRDIHSAGFGIKEILCVDTPPKPWPSTGFQLGAVHIQKGYKGDIKFVYEN